MNTSVEAKSNYVKVAVYYAPDAVRERWIYGYEPFAASPRSATRERVDSFIWPFTTAAEGGAALESALNVLDAAHARGLNAKLSIFKRAPSVPALDSVAVIFLRELGDDYDD